MTDKLRGLVQLSPQTAGAGAVTWFATILVWALSEFAGIDMPAEVALAVVALITTATVIGLPERVKEKIPDGMLGLPSGLAEAVSTDALQKLPADELAKLPTALLERLPVETLRALPREVLGTLPVEVLTGKFVQPGPQQGPAAQPQPPQGPPPGPPQGGHEQPAPHPPQPPPPQSPPPRPQPAPQQAPQGPPQQTNHQVPPRQPDHPGWPGEQPAEEQGRHALRGIANVLDDR